MILSIYGRLPKGGFTQMGFYMLNLLKAQLNYANILELTTSNCLLLVTRPRTHQFFCGNKPLHGGATNWIASGGLSNYFPSTKNIYYEASRELKINRIKSLDLGYFIDDLVQIFQDHNYPREIVSFLLSPTPSHLPWVHNVTSFVSVQEILINEE